MTQASLGMTLDQVTVTKKGAVLARLDTHIAPGRVLSVMGPSGVGKSSLLAAISGTLAPGLSTSGRVLLDDEDLTELPAHRRRIGMLFQDALLFPHLSVGANLGFGLPASVKGRSIRQARINAALTDVGLDGFAHRDPATLSGGQRARVALMRCLLSNPRALLLDEPFSGLDADLRHQTRKLVFERAEAAGLPVLLVTHDMDDASAAGGDIVTL